MQSVKPVLHVERSPATQWVGDGFHVRNFLPSQDSDRLLSPFLLLDYAIPTYFPGTDQPRGVGEHPHRGFETVTIVYQGRVQHRDSAGNQGTIGPGDVQWMTAGAGLVHEERHEKSFAEHGGVVELIQLWVNLPKAVKMTPPRYQTLGKEMIPVSELPDGAGQIRVIAGDFQGVSGPAKTFTPVTLYDIRLKAGGLVELVPPAGHNTALLILHGSVVLNGTQAMEEAALAVFDVAGEQIAVVAEADTTLLLMSGEPIRESIARRGPFVMNTEEELARAVHDYNTGGMGRLA